MTPRTAITKILCIVALLTAFTCGATAQGLYKKKAPEPVAAPRGGGLFKAPSRPASNELVPPLNAEGSPIGDGLFILAALGGGYLIAKRKKASKNNEI
jgi:hypothetical protein